MRFRIVSDGTVAGTRITNADTGEEIRGVTVIEWKADAAKSFAECTVKLIADVDLVGEGVTELVRVQRYEQSSPPYDLGDERVVKRVR